MSAIGGRYSLLSRWHALRTAACDSRLARSDVGVLAQILEHINRETGEAYPGMGRIARLANVDRRTVVRCVAKLTALGYVLRESGRRGKTNRYRMGGDSDASIDVATAVADVVEVVGIASHDVPTATSLKPSYTKPIEETQPASRLFESLFQAELASGHASPSRSTMRLQEQEAAAARRWAELEEAVEMRRTCQREGYGGSRK